MTTSTPALCCLAKGSWLLALGMVFGLCAPVAAHEGQPLETARLLARAGGEVQTAGVPGGDVRVALDSERGLQLRVVDLDASSRPATPIGFQVDSTQRLRLEILDLDGHVVRTLATGTWARGNHQLAWHHDSESGQELDGGTYVVRLVPEVPAWDIRAAR